MNIDKTLTLQLRDVFKALSKHDEGAIKFILEPYFDVVELIEPSDWSDSETTTNDGDSGVSYDDSSDSSDSPRPRVSNTDNSVNSDVSDASYSRAYDEMREGIVEKMSKKATTRRKKPASRMSRLDKIRDAMMQEKLQIMKEFSAPSESLVESERFLQPSYVQGPLQYPDRLPDNPLYEKRIPKAKILEQKSVSPKPVEDAVPSSYIGIQQCIAVMLD